MLQVPRHSNRSGVQGLYGNVFSGSVCRNGLANCTMHAKLTSLSGLSMAKILSLQAGQLDRLARRINAAHSKAGDAASKAVTHAIECGLALIEARAILDHGEWAKWIEANCSFSYRMAAHYIRVASTLPYLPAEKLKRVIQLSLRECIKAIAGNNTIAVMGSSESDEWHSPSSIFSLAVRLMGRVDLDPCAHRNSPVVARKRYFISDNGLSKSWRGTVFMNPPHRGIVDWIDVLSQRVVCGEECYLLLR